MKWIKCSERQPTVRKRYLVHRASCSKTHFRRWNGTGWAYDHNEITHWCEIEEPKDFEPVLQEDVDEDALFNDAILLWGHDAQIDMLQEECMELALAIRKLRRDPSPERYNDFCEELADVKIMVNQMEYVGNLPDDVAPHYDYKLQRLKKIIDDRFSE